MGYLFTLLVLYRHLRADAVSWTSAFVATASNAGPHAHRALSSSRMDRMQASAASRSPSSSSPSPLLTLITCRLASPLPVTDTRRLYSTRVKGRQRWRRKSVEEEQHSCPGDVSSGGNKEMERKDAEQSRHPAAHRQSVEKRRSMRGEKMPPVLLEAGWEKKKANGFLPLHHSLVSSSAYPPRCLGGHQRGLPLFSSTQRTMNAHGTAYTVSRRGRHTPSSIGASFYTPQLRHSTYHHQRHDGSDAKGKAAPLAPRAEPSTTRSLLDDMLRKLESGSALSSSSLSDSRHDIGGGTLARPSLKSHVATPAATAAVNEAPYIPLLYRSDFVRPHARLQQRCPPMLVRETRSAEAGQEERREVSPVQPRNTGSFLPGADLVVADGDKNARMDTSEADALPPICTESRCDAASPAVHATDEYPGNGRKEKEGLSSPSSASQSGEDESVPASTAEENEENIHRSDTSDGLEETQKSDSWSSQTPSRHRRRASSTAAAKSHTLILDPLEWLAQAPDAPLMDTDLLLSNTNVKDQLAELAQASLRTADPDTQDCYEADEAMDMDDDVMLAGVDTTAPRYPRLEGQETNAFKEGLLQDLLSDMPQKKRAARRKLSDTELPECANVVTASADAPSDTPPNLANAAASGLASAVSDAFRAREEKENAAPLSEWRTSNPLPLPTSPPSSTEAESDALVYNVFTRRVAKAGASSIRTLRLLGIHVDPASRELRLTDPDSLERLAAELRAARISWPRLWTRGLLYRRLERLLTDAAVSDVAKKVDELLQMQYAKSHQRHQTPGVVMSQPVTAVATSDGTAVAATFTSAHNAAAMAESVDDKLLTLQDLNEEQQRVVALILEGYHTYIGGGAGTGKSVLLRVIKQQLVREGLSVAMTGTTGIAGAQIGGATLHHCLGINLSGEFTRRKELSNYDVLIIDEVSMLSRELFESLELHLRRANNPHLPFGGIQLILCGDFLQLGAIDARPLITSPVFRSNFVQLKLREVVRQNENLRFAAQLQQLRRGQVPRDLGDTVKLVSPAQILAEQQAARALRQRQQTQLKKLVETSPAAPADATEEREEASEAALPEGNTVSQATDVSASLHGEAPPAPARSGIPFVEGAVNLLPTNADVHRTNAEQLRQLPGDAVTYVPQFLPPALLGEWSPTFILRMHAPAKVDVQKLQRTLLQYLSEFYTAGKRTTAFAKNAPRRATAAPPAAGFSDGAWLLHSTQRDRHLVLYPLFLDALVFRVRLPVAMEREEARQFLLYVSDVDTLLEKHDHGVRVRDILTHADGMHTEQDDYILSQYAARAPLANALKLKVGARVMLRTNLAAGLVNGSLGTVIGFRRLVLEELPRYLLGNGQREEAVLQYSDFLQYEQGFQESMVPVVDFNGRHIPIPPTTQYVGGLPNTHFYAMGIVALPLSLAYAFTVHKVQGLTLVGRVHLELSRMWPCEHLLYVAMSRVRNPEQLSVSSFHPNLVRAAADCLLFDDSLPSVMHAKILPYMLAATWRRSPGRRKKALLKKKLKADARRRRDRLKEDARKGDIRAEIELLEEKMLRQRARAAVSTAEKPSSEMEERA